VTRGSNVVPMIPGFARKIRSSFWCLLDWDHTSAGSTHSLLFVLKGVVFTTVLIALCSHPATAQLDSATLFGTLYDKTGEGIVGARVTLIDVERNTKRTATTDKAGDFVFTDVAPSRYRIEASARGFKTVHLTSFTLSTADTVEQSMILPSGPEKEILTVNSGSMPVQNSGTVSTTIDRKLLTELPLNGRSFQTLFQLTPGIVITPTSFASEGQFSVNGQRTDTNYFLVDGASANFGISVAANPGQSAGGSLPALTALGATNSLVSTDDVQEFAILTSSFAPEFGRTPGGQISIVTRSGTNEIHGELFDYLRNDAFDANDWFANQHNLRREALRQNDFGGVLGGPIRADKSFFFLSYEGLRLRQPTTGQSDVPSFAARQAASPSMRPFFNAYPLPNGSDEGNGLAQATYAFSNPSRLDAASLRVDHHIGESLTMFGRYNFSTSDQRLRGATITSLNSVTELHSTLQTVTVGSTWIKSQFTNATRLNWSRATAAFDVAIDGFGGATPVSTEMFIPATFSKNHALFQFLPALNAQHLELASGRNVANFQSQINLIDSFTWEVSGHSLKVGFDVRQLRPLIGPAIYSQGISFADISTALTGMTSLGVVEASTPVHSSFLNLSSFVQDSWRPTSRLTVTYGLRWDFTPAPTGRGDNGQRPFAVLGFTNLPALSLAPPGSPLYRATTNNFAPRFGVAYELGRSARTESAFKAGAGVFYDFGNGPIGNAFSGVLFPFSAVKILSGVAFPLSPSATAAPAINANPPFDQIVAFPAVLKLPYTYHWNISIEQSLGGAQTVTIGYVGSAGHSLLRTEEYFGGESGVPISFEQLLFTNNGGYSSYNALQVQLRRRASRGLDLVASYVLSHSLDNVSTDSAFNIPARFLGRHADYGPSDFDIRHTASIGIDYDFPILGRSTIEKFLASGWAVDSILTFRSSPPVNVVLSRAFAPGIPFRPDRAPGIPLYVDDSNAPGKVRINPGAFLVPVTQRQGDLGRNSLRGFLFLQADLALRRKFRLTDRMGVQVRIEAFNLFNHANFTPEANQLGVVDSAGRFSPQNRFGISANMLGNGFQTEGPGSGFSPLYQIGQARSLQAALRLEF
jgi:hypothetical protein